MDSYERMLKLAKKQFNINFDLDKYTEPQIHGLLEKIQNKKQKIMFTESFNSYHENKEYTKLLVLEGIVRMFLREVMPKRRLKKVKRHEKN